MVFDLIAAFHYEGSISSAIFSFANSNGATAVLEIIAEAAAKEKISINDNLSALC
jgi:hypothetical protein